MQVKSVRFSSDGKRSEFHNNKQAQMKGKKKRGRGGEEDRGLRSGWKFGIIHLGLGRVLD